MRLIKVTAAYQLFITAFLLALAGAALLFTILQIQSEETDEALQNQYNHLIQYIKKENKAVSISPTFEVVKVNSAVETMPSFSTVEILNRAEGDKDPYRELSSTVKINDNCYLIKVRVTLLEQQDLAAAIVIAMITVFVLLLVGIFILNFYLNRRIWSPFYNTLKQLQSYNIAEGGMLPLSATSILEFQQLNKSVEQLMASVSSDYKSLKSFTENASHEIQTPLALIIAKLEILMQEPSLSESNAGQLRIAYQSALRLSRLNSTLLLLVKIENRQFRLSEKVEVESLLLVVLEQMSDFVEAKHLRIHLNILSMPIWNANAELASVLVTNLVKNAIQHSVNGGVINITLEGNTLKIGNRGTPLTVDPSTLFQRFTKGNEASPSLGLGLALVKQIADAFGFRVTYSSPNDEHLLIVDF